MRTVRGAGLTLRLCAGSVQDERLQFEVGGGCASVEDRLESLCSEGERNLRGLESGLAVAGHLSHRREGGQAGGQHGLLVLSETKLLKLPVISLKQLEMSSL